MMLATYVLTSVPYEAQRGSVHAAVASRLPTHYNERSESARLKGEIRIHTTQETELYARDAHSRWSGEVKGRQEGKGEKRGVVQVFRGSCRASGSLSATHPEDGIMQSGNKRSKDTYVTRKINSASGSGAAQERHWQDRGLG